MYFFKYYYKLYLDFTVTSLYVKKHIIHGLKIHLHFKVSNVIGKKKLLKDTAIRKSDKTLHFILEYFLLKTIISDLIISLTETTLSQTT